MGVDEHEPQQHPPPPRRDLSQSRLSSGLKWGPLGIVVFWMVVMGGLYGAMTGIFAASLGVQPEV